MATSPHSNTQLAAELAERIKTNPVLRIAEYVASRAAPTSRGDVITELGLTANASTVFRWLNAATKLGYLNNSGEKRGSLYTATDSLRNSMMLRMIREEPAKRPRVHYVREFLDSYHPVSNPLLKVSVREQLMQRCPPGSMSLDKYTEHEVSMFMNEISCGSSQLEGNQYDLAATIALLEHDIENSSLPALDKIQIWNHRDACRYLIEGVKTNQPEFEQITGFAIRGIHTMLSKDLLDKRGGNSQCGTLRTGPVLIKDSSYQPPHLGVELASEFDKIVATANKIENPYEQSFFMLAMLPYLQPFIDCNKRTARVMCNMPLLKHGITPLSWLDTDHLAYREALLCVYEYNDTTLLSEVFLESFMRASERFVVMQRQREPSPISVKYRPMLRETMRARVLHDEERLPPSVAPEDASDYFDYVDSELRQMSSNMMLGLRYGLAPGVIQAWIARTADKPDPNHSTNMMDLERERG